MTETKMIFSNKYLKLYENCGIVYIKTIESGFELEKLEDLLLKYENIEITEMNVLEEVLKQQNIPRKIGIIKERINIEVKEDCMLATIIFNLTRDELSLDNREKLVRDTAVLLKGKGIVFGIKSEIFADEILHGEEYIIAEGRQVVDGEDAIVKMFEIEIPKPETIETGKIDYYELSLIPTVDAGAWLGERMDATEGTPGMTVTGKAIVPRKGVTLPLHYDHKYIRESKEGGKTILYSKEYGAVYFKGEEISLMNPLIIDGDVDFKTGNIIFDGFVIINGTICDGFYVEATKDIEVNGEIGLGNIKGIVSKEGSIYIKGGILCKGNVKVQAAKSVYLKFVDNVTVECGETAHFGFYCSNSSVTAKEVIVDAPKGQIKGGDIKAETRVISPQIGSELGKKTIVEVIGFSKNTVTNEINIYNEKMKDLKKEYDNNKQKIPYYEEQKNISDFQNRLLLSCQERIEEIRAELKTLGDKVKSLEIYAKARGDGEITTKLRIYPNTCLIIKKHTVEIKTATFATTYFFQNGKLVKV